MQKLAITLSCLSLMSLAACSGSSKSAQGTAMNREAGKEKTIALPCTPEGQTENIKNADVDGDGRDDVFKYYDTMDDPERPGERKTVLSRQDLDLNWDGKLDVCRYFNVDGKVAREEVDVDFDGKVDDVRSYENGIIVLSERDRNNDGRPDVIRRYKEGKLTQKDTDTNNDGQVDRWEYFTGTKLDRIGVDLDFDGKVDRWSKSAS